MHNELAMVKAPTSQNKLISGSGNGAEHEDGQVNNDWQVITASDIASPKEDLNGPSKSETPVELEGETGSQKTSSPAKKVMSAPGNTNRTTPTMTVKKVS